MPRGDNPNSRANLDKGRKFTAGDESARKASQNSKRKRRAIAELMKRELTAEERERLARELIQKMTKSPQWCELCLKMIGEMPKEEISVSLKKLSTEELEALEDVVLNDTRTGD